MLCAACRSVAFGLLVLVPIPGVGQDPGGRFRVLLGPAPRAAVLAALEGASRRLERAECQQLFWEFKDSTGVPLGTRLEAMGLNARGYLGVVVFADGVGRSGCRTSAVLAVTAPGARVVFICARQFREARARDPELTEYLVIHEALHTLGLGEDPPSSREITGRVRERCGE